jgi:hypothetical protein
MGTMGSEDLIDWQPTIAMTTNNKNTNPASDCKQVSTIRTSLSFISGWLPSSPGVLSALAHEPPF